MPGFHLFKWIYKNTNFHTYDYNIRNFLVSYVHQQSPWATNLENL